MPKISIQLVGGEKDGWPDCLEVSDGTRPEMVFIWRTEDDAKMAKVRGDARGVLAAKLGVLAYRFKDIVPKEGAIDGVEYRYQRDPKADKKMTSV
jgi:hypothetical protein